jgi:hypothetical protein
MQRNVDLDEHFIEMLHIPAEHEHLFWFNVNTDSGRT